MTATLGRILVVGASGHLGGAVARRLLAQGCAVRALSRTPARLGGLRELGAEVMEGNLQDAASLANACRGVERVVAAAHSFMGQGDSGPRRVDYRGNCWLIDAAKKARVGQLVFVSVYGARPDHPVDLFRVKHAVEEFLRVSGLPHTILRPAAFMETWAGWLGRLILRSRLAVIVGTGIQPINLVATDDVARLAVWSLHAPEAQGRVLNVGGPEDVTAEQVVRTFEQLCGTSVRKVRVPLLLVRAAALAAQPWFGEVARRVTACLTWQETTDQSVDMAETHRLFPMAGTRLEDWARQQCTGQAWLSAPLSSCAAH